MQRKRNVGGRADLNGIGMIRPAEGIAVLESALRAMCRSFQQCGSIWSRCPHDGENFRCSICSGRLTEFVRGFGRRLSSFLLKYWSTEESGRRGLLLKHLQTIVARTLGVNSADSIAVDQALSEMGLDSLASLELGNNLEESLRVTISSTIAYDYPTLVSMTDFFAGNLREPVGHPSAVSDQILAVTDQDAVADDEVPPHHERDSLCRVRNLLRISPLRAMSWKVCSNSLMN